MKKRLCLTLCLALLLGLFTGCVPEDTPYVPTGDALADEDADVNATIPEEEGEPQQLTLAYYADRSMNPFQCTDYTNRTLFSLIYQGLFSTNRDYRTVPILCDRYSTDSSNQKFTIYLAEDATFSDGSPVTIDDVMASYQAAQQSKYYEGRFLHIREFTLSEDGGITFSLRVSMEEFPLLLDIPIVKASQVDAEHPLGTGPYILEDSLAGAQLRRNQAWWCQSPDLAVTAGSIALVEAKSTTHIRDEFEFADVGLVCADPCSDAYADYRCDYELWDVDNGIFLFLGVNIAYSEEDTFADTVLRSALTYAIDRETIVRDIYNGFASPTTIPVSPNSPYYSASLAAKYEYDPVRFIEVVGRAPSTEEPLELLVNKDDGFRLRTAKAIVTMLQESAWTSSSTSRIPGASPPNSLPVTMTCIWARPGCPPIWTCPASTGPTAVKWPETAPPIPSSTSCARKLWKIRATSITCTRPPRTTAGSYRSSSATTQSMPPVVC